MTFAHVPSSIILLQALASPATMLLNKINKCYKNDVEIDEIGISPILKDEI